MGIINYFKNKFGLARQMIKESHSLENVMKEYEDARKRYIAMSKEESSTLSGPELIEAAFARTDNKVNRYADIIEGISTLNKAQKTFYSINYLDMEVQNGGLCQFFVNSSRVVAPFISECLETIGANEHKKLYDEFITQNQIDQTDLSSFNIDDVSEYEGQTRRYPFDDFDNAYYNLKPLENFLVEYVKQHIKEF